MKRFAYLLILLVLSAQVDDAWAVAPDLPSAPFADDNDEFLPAQRWVRDEMYSAPQSVLSTIKLHIASFPLVRRGISFEWALTTPFTPPALYAFMSLQI
jgi:hypothetical protein